MLKIWKRAWNLRGDSSQIVSESAQGAASVESSLLDTSIPETLSEFAEPSPPPATLKRARDIDKSPSTPTQDNRSSKILKRDDEGIDPLRNHLPEIIGQESIALPSMSVLRENILEQAKIENMIAVLPPLKASTTLLINFLKWSIDAERTQPNEHLNWRRIALFVVDDQSSLDSYTAKFETQLPNVEIENCSAYSPDPQPTFLVDVVGKDLLVASSQFLLDAMYKGTVAIVQFHTVIICDVQNITDQDCHVSMPIVQIMDEFYRTTDIMIRPRIFALATPSTDRWTHFDAKMLKLEATLDARVFGVTPERRAEIVALPDRPNEVVILYDKPSQVGETRLCKQLRQLDPTETIFRRYFKASRYALVELGPCASDLVWRRALKEIEASIPPWYADDEDDEDNTASVVNVKFKIKEIVKNWAFTMPNLDSGSRGFNITHKFLRLVHILRSCERYGDAFRGIIFVQRRAIAFILADLLRTLDDQLGFLRPYAVVGHVANSDSKHQQDIFNSFAAGAYNLLIATKSMEDLDVPKASVVVRYDLFESQVSHAYVRARTRGRESHLIHMVQRSNDIHRRILSQITSIDADMLRWSEILCNSPQSSVPPRSLRETINSYHSDSDDDDDDDVGDHIKDPTTGGRIYLQDATTVIYRFSANLRSKGIIVIENQPLFEFQDSQRESGMSRGYICTVLLPGTDVNRVSGPPSSSRALARRLACYKACGELAVAGLLDYRLFPLPSSLQAQYGYWRKTILQQEETHPREERSSGTACYPRKQPVFWTEAKSASTTLLYPTIVFATHTDDGILPGSPILILTRQALPELSAFKIFVTGVISYVHFQKAVAFSLSESRLQEVYMYTIRLCRAILNKPVVCPLEEIVYFFAPLTSDYAPSGENSLKYPNVIKSIPWDLVSLAAGNWALPINDESPEAMADDLRDAVIQDRWVEFTRRYEAIKLRRDLSPMSKPTDSPREAEYDNLVEFCKARRKGFDGLKDYNQPIIEVSRVPGVVNHLNPTSIRPTGPAKPPAKYLIPELCAKFTIPASTLRTAAFLPSVMRRVDDFLLVKELNAKFFDHAIREDLLHRAICAPSAGAEYDYERLELLGDAFLKYLSSVYVFVSHPASTEGSLHVSRQKIISNRSLLINSSRVGMPAYIQCKAFPAKSWLPPNFRIIIPPKVPRELVNKDDTADAEPELHAADTVNDDEAMDGEETKRNDVDVSENVGGDEDMDRSPHTDDDKSEVVELLLEASQNHIGDRNQAMDIDDISQSLVQEEQNMDDNQSEDMDLGTRANSPVVIALPLNDPNDGIAAKPSTNMAELSVDNTDPKSPALPQPEMNSSPPIASKAKRKQKKKKVQDDQHTQWLGDKAIADVAEAIIGAAYISGGRETALKVTKALTIPISNVDRWSDFSRKVLTPPPNLVAKLRPGSVEAIEGIIGHTFHRPHLLAQAMTHSSIQGYETTSYERLEFIGDAILDFMVIRHIFDRDQQLSPGALTLLKGAMVSNSALAAVCVWSGLHDHLLFESYNLATSIREYGIALKFKQNQEYETAAKEGRPPGQYWLELDPPKALSDVVESIVGAIYISDNFSPIGAEAFFDNVLKPFYDKHVTLKTLAHHPTKILFELFQAHGCQQFEILKEKEEDFTRCHVIVHDVILATGEDPAPTFAARRASIFALDALEGDAGFLTRTCSCRSHLQGKKSKTKNEIDQILISLDGGMLQMINGENE